MDNELARRRPATLVDTRARLAVAPYHARASLLAEVTKQARRGTVRPVDARPLWNESEGRWEMRVLQLRPAPPAWRKPALIGAAVASTLAVLLTLVYWVLVTLAALPLGLLCFFALAALAVVLQQTRTPSVQVTVCTSVRVK